MPVLEFALDPTAQHRVQVHLPTEQPAPINVMLNRSILGSLTPPEQGKDFVLPDNSLLQVRLFNGQLQVLRNGYHLPPIDANAANVVDLSPAALAQQRDKKLGGCLITWLILNLVVGGGVTLFVFVRFFQIWSMGYVSILLLLVSLLGILGLVGISLIFFWKKVGFYLVAGEVILTIVLSLAFGLGPNAFASLVSITILYIYLNRSGVWEKMS